MARIFVEGITFDYAHFIPSHPKCGRLHGHTGSVRVDIDGPLGDSGMVVDFAVAKRAVRDAIDVLDHRVLVRRDLVVASSDGIVEVRASRDDGTKLELRLADTEVFVMDADSTIEHIAVEVLGLVDAALARHGVDASRLSVECREGHDKGAVASR